MKPWLSLLALLSLVGCHAPSKVASNAVPAATSTFETTSSRLTSEQVIAWADLPKTLANPSKLQVGQADGQAILGDYVTLLNGADANNFLRQHGYAKTLRTLAVRRTQSTIEIDLEIEGKDGAKTTLTLKADGGKQGVG